MIRILGSAAVDAVFDEQAQATMSTFGDCFDILTGGTKGICDAEVETDESLLGRFHCTRDHGHDGFHIACGQRAVAVWN